MNVAVIGASNKPHRYSYQVLKLLEEKGHMVFPVHQRLQDIEGIKVYSSVKAIQDSIHTITMYVNAAISNVLTDDILALNFQRIIFNPGAENPELENQAREKGIDTINACTLVMLKTGQF